MMERSERPTGLTKDVGYQIGVRRTIPIRHKDAWRLLTSGVDLAEGARYQLIDGTVGQVRVLSPGSHLRISWQPPGWHRASTIQLRVIPKGDGTVVAFHQEHLPGATEREQRRAHYTFVLNELPRTIGTAT